MSDVCCQGNIKSIIFTAVSCHASVPRVQMPRTLCMCLSAEGLMSTIGDVTASMMHLV